MWGNKRGWLFSAFIVLVTVAGLFLLNQEGQPTPSTWDDATQQKYLAPITLKIPDSLASIMKSDCDAGDDYRAAIAAYLANKDAYDKFNSKDLTGREAFDDILKGTECRNMTLFAKDPAAYVDFREGYVEPLGALDAIKKAMAGRALMLLQDNKLDEARKYYQAIFSLGAKLWNERLIYLEALNGSGFMGDGVAGLRYIATKQKPPAGVAEFDEFDKARIEYAKNVMGPLRELTYDMVPENPGNIFLLAEDSHDRLWKIEGTRELGRLQWNVGEGGRAADQRAARHRLKRMAADPKLDPIVRLVAQKARDATAADLQAEYDATTK